MGTVTPPNAAADATGPDGPLLRFARWAERFGAEPLDPELARHAKRAVLDWFAATFPGADMPPARILERSLLAIEPPGGHAILMTSGRRAGVRTAALVNGVASHTAELDDIYREGIFHPGAPSIAAALALAQHHDVDGERFLRAVIVGYELSNRVAANIQPAHYRFWHTTGTAGALGAAAAAATILGLDPLRHAHALATATTMAAGLQQAFRSDAMSKPLHAGHAADAGVLAAISAEHDFTGALDILEGAAGFGVAMSDAPDWVACFDDLGTAYTIAAVTPKSHASCGHAFAAIDAVLQLRAEEGLDGSEVAAVEVGTYRVATEVAGNPDPRTDFEAKFSIPFGVATAIVRGSVRLDAFRPESLDDPAVRGLVARTRLVTDPELDGLFPTRRAARVRLELTDGRVLETTRRTRKGDPDDPLTDAEMQAKFDELAAPTLGVEEAAALSARIWALETLPSVRDLVTLPAARA
jgi:2-methylcitrate dehydratase PrpD